MKLLYTEQDYLLKKIKIAISLCGCENSIDFEKVKSEDELTALCSSARGYVLKSEEGLNVGRSGAILRTLANLHPLAGLYGQNDFSSAKVDNLTFFPNFLSFLKS